MALDVMRKSVALSVTWRILSPASPVRRKLSSSDKDLKKHQKRQHEPRVEFSSKQKTVTFESGSESGPGIRSVVE